MREDRPEKLFKKSGSQNQLLSHQGLFSNYQYFSKFTYLFTHLSDRMPTSLRYIIRNLIVGNDEFILSHTHYKRILLTGQLSLVSFIICVAYLVIDAAQGHISAVPYQLACALLSLTSLWLNRTRRFSTAKILLGLSVNITVFFFASTEPMEVGLYMYFIIGNTGALVAFGYEERGKAIFFFLLSTSLFFISLFSPFGFLAPKEYSHTYTLINITINFIGASFASATMVYFLININHRSESKLRKSEMELSKKNQELLKLNAELDRFVYNTSHDLKAPLNSILGLVQLMDLSNDVNEVREYSTMVKTRIADLHKFISEVADYSRNATSQITIAKVPVRKVVRDALEKLRYFPDANRLSIQLDIDDALEISTDVTRLQIVLNNLLSNAFKYQDKKKENPFVKVCSDMQGETISITIEDNGLGIPEQHIGKIFEMYSRANDQIEGTGLGLYIVRETIEKLGGTVSVDSKEGQGSKFSIRLPRQQILA